MDADQSVTKPFDPADADQLKALRHRAVYLLEAAEQLSETAALCGLRGTRPLPWDRLSLPLRARYVQAIERALDEVTQ